MFRRIFGVRFKKTSLLVLALCLIFISVPVLLILRAAQKQLAEEDVLDISFGASNERQVVSGTGINLTSLGSENLLLNGSFEPLVYRKEYTVYSGDNKTLLLAENDERNGKNKHIPLDDFFTGAKIEILTTQQGERRVKKVSEIEQIVPDIISGLHPYSFPPDSPKEQKWTAVFERQRESGSQIFLGASDGYILSNATGSMFFLRLPSRKDVKEIMAWGNDILFLDEQGGLFLYSPDTANFLPLFTDWKEKVTSVASGQDTADSKKLFLLTDKGDLYLTRDLETRESIRASRTTKGEALYKRQGQIFLLSKDNTLFQIKDETNWQEIFIFPENFQLLDLDLWQNTALFLSKRGELIFYGLTSKIASELPFPSEKAESDSENMKRQKSEPADYISSPTSPLARKKEKTLPEEILGLEEAASIPFKDISLVSDRHVFVINEAGQLLESKDAGKTWFVHGGESFFEKLSFVYITEDKSLLLGNEKGLLGSALLGATLTLSSPLEEDIFEAGDTVRLEKHSPLPWQRMRDLDDNIAWQGHREVVGEAIAGDWYVAQNTHAFPRIESPGPPSGKSALLLQKNLYSGRDAPQLLRGIYGNTLLENTLPAEKESLRLVHKLSDESLNLMQGNSAFELIFWAKADCDEAHVDLALTAPNMPNDPVKRYLSKEWKEYSVVFIIPWSVAERSDLRVIFDFLDCEEASVDRVRLRKIEEESPYKVDLEKIQTLSPLVIRLAYLQIGESLLPSEFYFEEESQFIFGDDGSLHNIYSGTLSDTVKLLQQVGAQPWLCIGSSVSETELRHIMQYLFGSRQSEYGLLRVQGGTLSRWNELFDMIYIEFSELDTAYFNSDSERQLFVDWAISIISSTPEYAQVRNQVVFVDGMQYQDGVMLSSADTHASDFGLPVKVGSKRSLDYAMSQKYDNFLRDPMRALSLRPEIFRSFPAGGSNLRLADYMAQMLHGLGKEVSFTLLDVGQSSHPFSFDLLTGIFYSLENISGMAPYTIRVEGTAEIEESPVVAFAYGSREEKRLFILNLGDEVSLVRIYEAVNDKTCLREYDAAGILLTERKMSRRDGTLALLPGAMMVIEYRE